MSRLSFGPFELDRATGELWEGERRIRLQDQPRIMLEALLERPGELVSREALKKRIWGEGIHVDFEDGLNAAAWRLRQALRDEADHPAYLETLPRKGYRFVGQVRNESDVLDMAGMASTPGLSFGWSGAVKAHPAPAPQRRASDRRRRLFWASLIVVALAGGAAWELRHASPSAHIGSVAVLPLHDLTGDPAKAYIPAGLTDELTTELAKLHDLRVAARGALGPETGSTPLIKDIAKRLGVDAVVEGSLVRDGDRYRYLVNLVGSDGRTIWGETYESDEQGLQPLQAQVARDLQAHIHPSGTRTN